LLSSGPGVCVWVHWSSVDASVAGGDDACDPEGHNAGAIRLAGRSRLVGALENEDIAGKGMRSDVNACALSITIRSAIVKKHELAEEESDYTLTKK